MSPRHTDSPGLGAVALIAALSAVAGLVVARALLTLPVELTARGGLVLALLVAGQALAWWWVRRHQRPLAVAAWRLVTGHPVLALWAGAEVVGLGVLWAQRTAGWSRVGPAWGTVAIYAGVRAALLALAMVGLLLRRNRRAPAAERPSSGADELPVHAARASARVMARAQRVMYPMLLGAALAAPALLPLVGSRPAWQSAVVAGLLALLGTAAVAPADPDRDTWIGLALLLSWPAAALALAALALGEAGLPLAAQIALSALLPALGLATLAAPALLSGIRNDDHGTV